MIQSNDLFISAPPGEKGPKEPKDMLTLLAFWLPYQLAHFNSVKDVSGIINILSSFSASCDELSYFKLYS